MSFSILLQLMIKQIGHKGAFMIFTESSLWLNTYGWNAFAGKCVLHLTNLEYKNTKYVLLAMSEQTSATYRKSWLVYTNLCGGISKVVGRLEPICVVIRRAVQQMRETDSHSHLISQTACLWIVGYPHKPGEKIQTQTTWSAPPFYFLHLWINYPFKHIIHMSLRIKISVCCCSSLIIFILAYFAGYK